MTFTNSVTFMSSFVYFISFIICFVFCFLYLIVCLLGVLHAESVIVVNLHYLGMMVLFPQMATKDAVAQGVMRQSTGFLPCLTSSVRDSITAMSLG